MNHQLILSLCAKPPTIFVDREMFCSCVNAAPRVVGLAALIGDRRRKEDSDGPFDQPFISTITTSRIGPCAPCTRIFSISAVRLEPLITQA